MNPCTCHSCLSAPSSSVRVRCADAQVVLAAIALLHLGSFGDGASAAAARKGIVHGRARDPGARSRATAGAGERSRFEGAGRSRSPRAVLHLLLFGGCRGASDRPLPPRFASRGHRGECGRCVSVLWLAYSESPRRCVLTIGLCHQAPDPCLRRVPPTTDDGLAGLVGATYPPHQYSSHSEMCAGHVGR